MKTPKNHLFTALVICVLLTACSPAISYLGENYEPTYDVKIYYAARDVKRNHKVMGHLTCSAGFGEDAAKKKIIEKAQAVGADGVVFTGLTFTGGKDSYSLENADAIKFTDNKNEAGN